MNPDRQAADVMSLEMGDVSRVKRQWKVVSKFMAAREEAGDKREKAGVCVGVFVARVGLLHR
jgi:hypothetical protein